MKSLPRLFTLLLLMSTMTCWATPAQAARLANVTGEAGGAEVREDAEFKLGDHSEVEIRYDITKVADGCSVKVRVHRKQGDGKWLVVNTTLRTSGTTKGSRTLTLPAGDYKIEVIGKQAKYDVSVDN